MGSLSLLNRSYKGCSGISISRLSDGVVYSFPVPLTVNLDAGITQRTLETRGNTGNKARARTFANGEMPTLTIAFGHVQLESIAFRLGQQLALGNTLNLAVPRQVYASAATIPADTAGGLYFGVALDSPSPASVVRKGISTPLTQVNVAAFAAATPDTYAVGASGELLLSDNLVTDRCLITIVQTLATTETASLSDLLVGEVQIRAKFIDNNNGVTLLNVSSASINLEGNNIDMNGENGLEMSFLINDIPGVCRQYELHELTDVVLQC